MQASPCFLCCETELRTFQPAKTFAADKEQKTKRNELERKELEEQKVKDKEKNLSIELKHNTLAMKVPNSSPKKVLILLTSPKFQPNPKFQILDWLGALNLALMTCLGCGERRVLRRVSQAL